jgi:putative Mn2+ efflux pump MntP
MNRKFLIGAGIIFLLGFVILIAFLSNDGSASLTKEQVKNTFEVMDLFGILASLCLGFGMAKRY